MPPEILETYRCQKGDCENSAINCFAYCQNHLSLVSESHLEQRRQLNVAIDKILTDVDLIGTKDSADRPAESEEKSRG